MEKPDQLNHHMVQTLFCLYLQHPGVPANIRLDEDVFFVIAGEI